MPHTPCPPRAGTVLFSHLPDSPPATTATPTPATRDVHFSAPADTPSKGARR
ncbi:hypothetical protein GCM10027445_08000 [Amycolatopsis endophytica]|uniref:Uncharacterized protein n=1 Tax=Amycolatopsis endophytica TaxID=860233 RepID=A0A853AWM2_9PSEU|nr:hypothetical protein [Amycolatopsis endophytica]NYI87039.1 hypothetical protein [Amycolatopsis endophytica]